MELVILGLIVLFIYAFIRGWPPSAAWMTGAPIPGLSPASQRFNGRYESRGISDPPTVSFLHHGTTVRVGLAPTIPGQPVNPQDAGRRAIPEGDPVPARARPGSRPAPPQAPRAPARSRPASPSSTADFVVQANDPEMARDFLNPQVRWAVANLQRLVHPGGMLVSINPERLLVQIDRNLGTRPRGPDPGRHPRDPRPDRGRPVSRHGPRRAPPGRRPVRRRPSSALEVQPPVHPSRPAARALALAASVAILASACSAGPAATPSLSARTHQWRRCPGRPTPRPPRRPRSPSAWATSRERPVRAVLPEPPGGGATATPVSTSPPRRPWTPTSSTLLGQGALRHRQQQTAPRVIPAVSQGIPIVYVATIYGQFPLDRAGQGRLTGIKDTPRTSRARRSGRRASTARRGSCSRPSSGRRT